VTRCRLCTSNDREGLIEQLAERMWESRRDREIDYAWAECGEHWQRAMRLFARETVEMLEAG
jgi:hypothetical protein